MNNILEKKAVNYSILFLEREIKEIQYSIDHAADINIKTLLSKRLSELKSDYKELTAANEELEW